MVGDCGLYLLVNLGDAQPFFRAKTCIWIRGPNTNNCGNKSDCIKEFKRNIFHNSEASHIIKPVNPVNHGCLSRRGSPWGSLQAHDEINHQSSVLNAAASGSNGFLRHLNHWYLCFALMHPKLKTCRATGPLLGNIRTSAENTPRLQPWDLLAAVRWLSFLETHI